MQYILLARELGMHLREMLATLTSAEITEQLAASSLINSSDWREEIEREVELERQRRLPLKERVALQKAAFSRPT